MPLICNWGDTPAYRMLKPIWDSIDVPKGTDIEDTEEWAQQPALVHLLDGLLAGGMWGPPIAYVLNACRINKITQSNVSEVYGRMRAFETITEGLCISNVGLYNPVSGEYTKPDKPSRGYPMSPWLLSMFVGFSANWGWREDRQGWVKWIMAQPEAKGMSHSRITDMTKMYKDSYVQEMSKYTTDMAALAV